MLSASKRCVLDFFCVDIVRQKSILRKKTEASRAQKSELHKIHSGRGGNTALYWTNIILTKVHTEYNQLFIFFLKWRVTQRGKRFSPSIRSQSLWNCSKGQVSHCCFWVLDFFHSTALENACFKVNMISSTCINQKKTFSINPFNNRSEDFQSSGKSIIISPAKDNEDSLCSRPK